MRIIPVLDLKGGQVVRAAQGRRDEYRPIITPLSATSDPVEVATGLRALYPFGTFYCADLDAIEGRAANAAAIAKLKAMPDPPDLWIDAGLSTRNVLDEALADASIFPVLGTETQLDDQLMSALREHPRLILSLDFFAGGYRGPTSILENPGLWPQTVIVMTLARVGAATGPDFERLQEIKRRAGNRTIVAAGGIRNERDLHALSAMGVKAALLATSLHDGTLTAVQLASFDA